MDAVGRVCTIGHEGVGIAGCPHDAVACFRIARPWGEQAALDGAAGLLAHEPACIAVARTRAAHAGRRVRARIAGRRRRSNARGRHICRCGIEAAASIADHTVRARLVELIAIATHADRGTRGTSKIRIVPWVLDGALRDTCGPVERPLVLHAEAPCTWIGPNDARSPRGRAGRAISGAGRNERGGIARNVAWADAGRAGRTVFTRRVGRMLFTVDAMHVAGWVRLEPSAGSQAIPCDVSIAPWRLDRGITGLSLGPRNAARTRHGRVVDPIQANALSARAIALDLIRAAHANVPFAYGIDRRGARWQRASFGRVDWDGGVDALGCIAARVLVTCLVARVLVARTATLAERGTGPQATELVLSATTWTFALRRAGEDTNATSDGDDDVAHAKRHRDSLRTKLTHSGRRELHHRRLERLKAHGFRVVSEGAPQ